MKLNNISNIARLVTEDINFNNGLILENNDPAHLDSEPDSDIVLQKVKAKKIVPALATEAITDCEILTIETGNKPILIPKGNLILSGIKGELWSPGNVSILNSKYDVINVPDEVINNFRKKNPNALMIPCETNGLKSGEVKQLGFVMKKGAAVNCYQINVPFTVKVSWQTDLLNGKPGDWFIIYGPGDFGAVDDKIFNATYRRESDLLEYVTKNGREVEYPVHDKEHTQSAIGYIMKYQNKGGEVGRKARRNKAKVARAAKRFGIELPKNW